MTGLPRKSDMDALSSGMFDRVIRALDVAYYEWTVGGAQICVSPALADMFGFDPDTWTVKRQTELIHPDDRPGFRAALATGFKSGAERVEFTYRMRRSAGDYRWLINRGLLERDDAGRVTRLTGAVSDITEAKEREAQNRNLIAGQTAGIEHQSATIDVLKAMSSSPGNAQPVFEIIVRRACELCDAPSAAFYQFDGRLVHFRVEFGAESIMARGALEAYRRQFPMPPTRGSFAMRAIMDREIVHIRDIAKESGVSEPSGTSVTNRILSIPLLRNGEAIGSISLSGGKTGGFTDSQVELLRTFAEQAVIAIGSAETYRELQARTAALAERNIAFSEQVEHQSATIDVLKAMSASPGDAQPVFDLIVHRAAEVCNAPNAVLFRYDGELLHWQATSGADAFASPEAFEALRRRFPMAPSRESSIGRSILSGRISHVRDIDADPDLYQQLRDIGMKSLVGVPLLRDGVPLGVIGLSAREPGGFSDSQVALLETFAEQAVIAIGSAETYRELQARTAALAERNSEYGERIEHQSATIDVLKVMSASPGDTQPVFDLIVRRAAELCNSSGAGLLEFDGELVHFRTSYGVDPAAVRAYAAIFPMIPTRESIACRSIIEKQVIHIRDMDAEPGVLQVARNLGMKSNIAVPLLRDSSVVGALTLTANEPGGFSDSQVELLQTFAEQAVIAIGSAETYRALQQRTEALTRSVEELRAAEAELLATNAALDTRNSEYGEQIQHQSATIDVLKVMSASPGDPQPVFDLIVRRAQELCNGMSVGLFEYDGSLMHIGASFGGNSTATSRFEAMFPMAPARESLAGRAILDGRIVHIRDMSAEPRIFQTVRDMGAKTTIALPLLRDGVPIGAISLNSPEPGGFSDSQIELLKTFAEQAVIAIGSAETYRELQARTAALAQRNSEFGERIEQQAATIDVLKAMSDLPDDTQPVFDLIARRAAELCESRSGLWEFDGTLMHARAHHGLDSERIAAFLRLFPRAPDQGTAAGRAILEQRVVHVHDVAADARMSQASRDLGGTAIAAIPFLPRRSTDRRHRVERKSAWRLRRQPNRLAPDVRRTGGDRHHQRRQLPGLAGTHRRAHSLGC